ncbi:MAG: alpha/beta hydrolase-fold protein [Bacteroidota bacterium]
MKPLFLSLPCLLFSIFTFAQKHSGQPFTIGETISFHSDVLNEQRLLNIYLPNNYNSNDTIEYDVIYLLDGSVDEDFIHIAGIVQFANFEWINLIPKSIVVGIENVDRQRDFTYPTSVKEDKDHFTTSGGSAQFMNFVEKEVQTMINQKYRVNNMKTLIGQSLGGLMATEFLMKKPDLFDNYIIISPSLWWDNESLLKAEPKITDNIKAIYIGVGKEGEVMERVAKELHDKIDRSEKKNAKLMFQFFEKHDHGDVLHQAVYDAFEKIYKP